MKRKDRFVYQWRRKKAKTYGEKTWSSPGHVSRTLKKKTEKELELQCEKEEEKHTLESLCLLSKS